MQCSKHKKEKTIFRVRMKRDICISPVVSIRVRKTRLALRGPDFQSYYLSRPIQLSIHDLNRE